ncbi:MAG: hypothetical protein KC502_00545 [Myxococcales bacterium]|nr:hypothetical protein [Myxococcales bacterium]
MATAVHRLQFTALLALTATLVSACGGDEVNHNMPGSAPAGPAKVEAVPDPVLENYDLLGENPQWSPIQRIFKRYEKKKIEALANPLQSNLVTFVEKPIIERKTTPDEAAATLPVPGLDGDADVDKDDPRRKFALERYRLIILMTGTPRPKAVVLGPGDERFELSRGDPLGKEGGRIRAVTQFSMLIAMPGKTQPIEVSLRPPLARKQLELAPKKVDKKAEF